MLLNTRCPQLATTTWRQLDYERQTKCYVLVTRDRQPSPVKSLPSPLVSSHLSNHNAHISEYGDHSFRAASKALSSLLLPILNHASSLDNNIVLRLSCTATEIGHGLTAGKLK